MFYAIYKNELMTGKFFCELDESVRSAIAHTNTALDRWQAWSDRNFGDLQAALILLFQFTLAVAIAVTRFSKRHLGIAFEYWAEQANREVAIALLLSFYQVGVERVRRLVGLVKAIARFIFRKTKPVLGALLCVNW